MSSDPASSNSGAVLNRYVTAALLFVVLGGALSALGIGPGFGADAGLPVPYWGIGVLAGVVLVVGFVQQLRAN